MSLQADSGVFASVTLAMSARRIAVAFAPPAATPARAQTYDVLRLRVDKLAVNATRPGSNFRVVEPAAVTVVVAYDA